MEKLLNNRLNLEILLKICSGDGLDLNLRKLSKVLGKHRETVRKRVSELLHKEIIDRPIYPFTELFREYPIFVTAYADFPDDEDIREWIRFDKNIFAAFRVREGDYNMMLFEFHKSLDDYLSWRKNLTAQKVIPERGGRIPSNVLYISNKMIKKYDPNSAKDLIVQEFKEKGRITLNDYPLDKLSVKLIENLLSGVGIKLNENKISKDLGYHRATIKKRINNMLEGSFILEPLCRFPAFFIPPDFLLVFSMIEIKRHFEKFIDDIRKDPHVNLAYQISQGRYNLLLFEAHRSIESYLMWEDYYSNQYSGCLGSIKNNYLSPRMTISIDQQKVSLGAIEDRLIKLQS